MLRVLLGPAFGLAGCDSRPAPPTVTPPATVPTTAQDASSRPDAAPRQRVIDALQVCLGNVDRAKFNTGRTRARVLSDQPVGATVDAMIVDTFRLPERLRRELSAEMRRDNHPPEKVEAVYIWNGRRGWRTAEDGSLVKADSAVPAHNLFPYPYLLVLDSAAAPDAVLSANGEVTWDGRRAVSVRVQNPGSAARDLFFDAESKLLIGARGEMPNPMTGRVTSAKLDMTFSEFRDVHGARLPLRTSVMMEGKRLFDVTVLDFEPLENPEERLFLGPEPRPAE